MANAVAVVSIPDNRYSFVFGNKYAVIGTLAISASPAVYVTGGIAMNLFNSEIKASRTPVLVLVTSSGVAAGTIYDYDYIAGADASAGLLKISTGGAEIAASAIPAGVSGDTTIQFIAIFQGME